MNLGFIIIMSIIAFLALATVCGMIENCVRIVSKRKIEMYKIYCESSIKNDVSETAQMELNKKRRSNYE